MDESPDDIVGSGSTMDGRRVPITRAEADAFMENLRKRDAEHAARMPTTKEAVNEMFYARERLKKLGWKEGQYCPKDGSPFAAIEYGSTGIFTGSFHGEWPYDFADIEDGGMHPYGFLWKPIEELTEWEESARTESMESTRQFNDRIGRMAEHISDAG